MRQMGNIVPKASDFEKLPIDSVNYCLDLLQDLYYAVEEVPDTLRQFIGAYPHSNCRSLLLLPTALVNTEGKIDRQISQHELLKFSKEWFANLVMKETFSFLDSAIEMWYSIRSGKHCLRFATGKPHENIVHRTSSPRVLR